MLLALARVMLQSAKLRSLLVLALSAACCSAPQSSIGLPVAEAWSKESFQFGGHTWTSRHSDTLVAAGPNFWSNSSDSIFADKSGLHLQLTPKQGRWYSSEVSTVLPADYCKISLDIEGELGSLDTNVIAAVFVYLNDQSEFDIEFGRFGEPGAPNLQFVVAPAFPSERRHRLQLEAGTAKLHLEVRWLPDSISFSATPPGASSQQWTFVGKPRPIPSAHRLHINLWLHAGQPPRNEAATEIVVSNVTIQTLDA